MKLSHGWSVFHYFKFHFPCSYRSNRYILFLCLFIYSTYLSLMMCYIKAIFVSEQYKPDTAPVRVGGRGLPHPLLRHRVPAGRPAHMARSLQQYQVSIYLSFFLSQLPIYLFYLFIYPYYTYISIFFIYLSDHPSISLLLSIYISTNLSFNQ